LNFMFCRCVHRDTAAFSFPKARFQVPAKIAREGQANQRLPTAE
jgi:hypothetical protein